MREALPYRSTQESLPCRSPDFYAPWIAFPRAGYGIFACRARENSAVIEQNAVSDISHGRFQNIGEVAAGGVVCGGKKIHSVLV